MTIQFKTYSRKPFSVDGLEITKDNMEEIAALVGKMGEKDGVACIVLDRRLIPSIRQAYPGYYITRREDEYRIYSPRVFRAQFELKEVPKPENECVD